MPDISKIFYLLASVFLLLGLFANFLSNNFPKIPGDIYIDRPGIKVYIPITSSLILSILLSFLLNLFRK